VAFDEKEERKASERRTKKVNRAVLELLDILGNVSTREWE
jgi:hypothetical protein